MTVDEFDVFVMLPENRHRLLEFIGGEVVEVVSSNYSSMIGSSVAGKLVIFVDNYHLGFVTGANGGYKVAGERYIPKAAFVANHKQPEPSNEPYNPIAPDLAVEVLSPSNDDREMRIKLVNYLRAGTTLWIIDGDRKQVGVYSAKYPPIIVGIKDVLDGGDVLPGFTLAVREIFAE